MTSDTFERSCAHWSEAGRSEMERFYAIASVDYEHLAKARDWRIWLKDHAARAPGPLRLLDVACGSGKFPAALHRHAAIGESDLDDIAYSLLDPSRFSIEEAKAQLEPPFIPAREFEVTLQALECEPDAFDVAWATHALYAAPREDLAEGLARLIKACSREIVIGHAFCDAHYIKFQQLFLEAFDRTGETPYCHAEDITAALDQIGARHTVSELAYQNGSDDRELVEGFLQRCVFDESVTLDQMEASSVLAPYLEHCRTDGRWVFDQRVALIAIQC
ncbi:MAG: class I SAM-dependent methyltransferase [Erythrobacter sp.]